MRIMAYAKKFFRFIRMVLLCGLSAVIAFSIHIQPAAQDGLMAKIEQYPYLTYAFLFWHFCIVITVGEFIDWTIRILWLIAKGEAEWCDLCMIVSLLDCCDPIPLGFICRGLNILINLLLCADVIWTNILLYKPIDFERYEFLLGVTIFVIIIQLLGFVVNSVINSCVFPHIVFDQKTDVSEDHETRINLDN